MSTITLRDDKTIPMSKKKDAKGSGDSPKKTTRINVGVPEEWHAVMRRLAGIRKQPVTYLLIAMLQEAAEREGITDLPPPPWEQDE